ncbi:MAG TPA: hypothetical protein VGK10_16535 [Prolixibacteraceae bacterium]
MLIKEAGDKRNFDFLSVIQKTKRFTDRISFFTRQKFAKTDDKVALMELRSGRQFLRKCRMNSLNVML